jgi:hypothetical protein
MHPTLVAQSVGQALLWPAIQVPLHFGADVYYCIYVVSRLPLAGPTHAYGRPSVYQLSVSCVRS